MESFFEFKKQIIITALKAVFIISGALFLLSAGSSLRGLGAGFLLGGLISIINFQLQAVKAAKIVGMKSQQGGLFIFKWTILRYPLYILALIIAIKRNDVSLITTIAGFFTCASVIIWHVIRQGLPQSNSAEEGEIIETEAECVEQVENISENIEK